MNETEHDKKEKEKPREEWEDRIPPTFEEMKANEKKLMDKGVFDQFKKPDVVISKHDTEIATLKKEIEEKNMHIIKIEKECHHLLETLTHTTKKYLTLATENAQIDTATRKQPQEDRTTRIPMITPRQNNGVLSWFMQRSLKTKIFLVFNPITTILMGCVFGRNDFTVGIVAFCWIAWFLLGVALSFYKLCRA